jgi:hypothetical protein
VSGKGRLLWTMIERRVDDMVFAGASPALLVGFGTELSHRVGCPIRVDARVPRGMICVVDERNGVIPATLHRLGVE